ncbi:unnamed protein product [Tilletia caries]|uniref:Uncharacterized protein n=1 Tax=Tilletia caries TaxID=13290 RepID=A0ABN7J6T0_9BASI|nr:unnamed protein product [Tilletia caries]
MLLCMLYLAIFAYYIKDEPLAHRGLIFTLLWTPIPFASYYQAWAISYADIDGRAASFASGGSNLAASHRKRKQVPAWLVNWTWALLPFISIGSVLNTALLSDQQWETARHGWYQWRSTYANATEISREMLLDAQDIWTSELRGAHFYTIGNIIWIVNLVGGGTLHVTLAGLLIFRLLQSLTVCTAAAIFLFILLYFTIGCVPMLEAGRPDILHNVAWHAIMVNTFLCGTATIISSTHTYFEDTFAALMNGELPASILAGNALTRPRVQQPSLQEHGRTRSSPTAFTQGTATPDSGSVNPSTVTRELLQLAEK